MARNQVFENLVTLRRTEWGISQYAVVMQNANLVSAFGDVDPETRLGFCFRDGLIIHAHRILDYTEFEKPGFLSYPVAIGTETSFKISSTTAGAVTFLRRLSGRMMMRWERMAGATRLMSSGVTKSLPRMPASA